MQKWTPKDIITALVICVAAGLLFTGRDTAVGWTLVAVVMGYYGVNLKIQRKQNKNGGE